MKKLFYLGLVAIMLITFSCEPDRIEDYKTYELAIELAYPKGYNAKKDVPVTLTNSSNSKILEAKTDDRGIASFKVIAGIYDAAVTDNRNGDGVAFVLNGAKTGIAITDKWTGKENIKVELSESKLSQVIIKEIMYGGTPKDDGSTPFIYDSYVVLYNNSSLPAKLDNICLGASQPYGSNASFNSDYVNDKLFYEAEGWVPAGEGIWYFREPVTFQPYSQLVIALFNAVDNTQTYSQSVNFAKPEYYCTYDIDVYNHILFYPSPSSIIPTSHYLKAVRYGNATAWAFTVWGPAVFIFTPEGQTKEEFCTDATNFNIYNGKFKRKKVPVEWVIDGMEVFTQGVDNNKKRLNSIIDAGYVFGTKGMGYTIYRNVDKKATEALKENEGKLVYNYTMGTKDIEGGTTDPSGIDAEASIKNGAKIVYMDTNNSSKDFHQRKEASLRYK